MQFSDPSDRVMKERAAIKRTRAKVFNLWVGPFNPFVSVTHPDTAKLLLKSSEPKPVFEPGSYFFIKNWLGMGLLLSYGPKWERNRRLLTPAFHFDILKPYIQVYNDVADLFMNNIASCKNSKNCVEIYNLVSLATLDTMLKCAFSYNDGVQTTSNPLKYPDWIYHFTQDGKDEKRLCDYVHKFAEDIIAARRKSLTEDQGQLQKCHLDFLDILITAKDQDGLGLSDEDIRAEVDTFLFAGHDTTASAISWAAYYLGKHPDMQEEVYQEVKRLTQGKEYFTWENINECKQLTMFVKESMRSSSPVPGVVRHLTKPFNFDGVTIPAGMRVAVLIHQINHHPDVWDEPEVFRPERFLEDASKERDPYAYVPFSAGPR
ncbi:hypothetical protein FSP39_009268 [Pinctada imbricata]|uniref:Uncharacterized protein n=1 Tax=Pinctada imbricata TaxID=66713 RepID=A0AA88XW39_PINIB|nr:hypothetical protein FSP39_009268 [Pinctada imbricata]